MSSKRKLFKFAQIKTFPNLFERVFEFNNPTDFSLKSNWNSNFFKNEKKIILELGCGKGEYTVGLAQKYPQFNYIGVDIKGARLWKGATDSLELKLENVAFVRTMAEFSPFCFGKNEIEEIWITFPDPQLGPRKRIRKRLTSSDFLTRYRSFLVDNGVINLKTDDDTLYNYTKSLIQLNNLELLIDTDNLYDSDYFTDVLAIKTHYEKMWNREKKTIKYLRFRLPAQGQIIEPPYEDKQD
jgi:tRNA (guanine-N7-)-methyltransferase